MKTKLSIVTNDNFVYIKQGKTRLFDVVFSYATTEVQKSRQLGKLIAVINSYNANTD